MKNKSNYYIENLKMNKHPEGGYYARSYKSDHHYNESHDLWTSIYFLLNDGEVSNFHRLQSDEMWYFHDGSPLTIYMINLKGELITQKLGLNLDNGEKPQFLVPKGYIFGSKMNTEGFSLVGCMVSPGFTFEDFELFTADTLISWYPEHSKIIKELTNQ